MAEKTEKATPKKIRDARKKGQVAKSQDFPSAFTFATAILGTLFLANFLFRHLSEYIISTFRLIQYNIDIEHRAGEYITQAIMVIATTSFPIVLLVSIMGVLVNFLIIGPLFSMEALKFNLKRLNPVEGIKQKFKLKVLVELIKSILKISGAAFIIYLAIWKALPSVVQTAGISVVGTASLLGDFLRTITIQVGLFFLAVGIFDLFFQKKTYAKEMMMEKFEVRQEFKDTEGDPHIKGKRRELFREIAYTEGPGAAKRARAIITNPEHIAVAVGGEEAVPIILVMGRGVLAEKIIQIAVDERIPIMRNVALAQELYQKGKISDYIPEETYKAVAQILRWVSSLEEKPAFLSELLS